MASGAPAFRGEGAERNRAILHEQLLPLKPAAGARKRLAAVLDTVIGGSFAKDATERRQRKENRAGSALAGARPQAGKVLAEWRPGTCTRNGRTHSAREIAMRARLPVKTRAHTTSSSPQK
jgi:hypothetical protein